MLDPRFIRENAETVRKKVTDKNYAVDVVDDWLKVDGERAEALMKVEQLRAEKNELNKQVPPPPEAIARGKELKAELEQLEAKFKDLDATWLENLNKIPNLAFDDVPVGKGEDANVEVKRTEIPTFDFEPKDHATLGAELDLLDFEAGAKVAGSQFYFLKNEAVQLEFALIQWGLNKLQEKGFTLVMTPDMAKSRFYLGTGYQPKGDEAQIYEIEGEDLGLIATAEVTMAGYHADEILNLDNGPLRYAAISHCFRKEAGAYGKYSKGLYRVHQFTKLEMFAYCTPEQSADLHQEFLNIEMEIADELGLPYRVLEMCTGDLGAIAAKKYDVEAWMPGRRDFGEITSTSNCTDFQARNLNIRFKDKNGENKHAHMLNGTAIALSRIPIAIIENFQNAEGKVRIPPVLQSFMGKDIIG